MAPSRCCCLLTGFSLRFVVVVSTGAITITIIIIIIITFTVSIIASLTARSRDVLAPCRPFFYSLGELSLRLRRKTL